MQSPHSASREGIESELLDLGDVSLARLRTLDDQMLRHALQHAVERVSYIQVTASGSGAKRVD
jgi:hypothetical protein